MPSYQDIETRLRVVEDKLDFLMKMGSVTKREESRIMPGQMIETRMNFLDLYRMVKTQGLDLQPQVEQENA